MRVAILFRKTMLRDVVSKRIALPLLKVQQRFCLVRRAAVLASAEGLQFRIEAQNWPEPRRKEWVLKQLRFVVRAAVANTAYYADRFRRVGFDSARDFGFEEFVCLPVLERQDIMAAG